MTDLLGLLELALSHVEVALSPCHGRERQVDLAHTPCHARPVHLIITMIKWVRTSRLTINNSRLAMVESDRRIFRTLPAEREFFIDNLLVRIHFIIVMIRWTGLARWEFEFPFPRHHTPRHQHPPSFDRTSRHHTSPRVWMDARFACSPPSPSATYVPTGLKQPECMGAGQMGRKMGMARGRESKRAS